MTTATKEKDALDGVTVSVNGGPEVPANELFDAKKYDVPVPKLDGHRADTIKVAFAGGVEVDVMVGPDLDYFKSLKLGQEIELTVSAIVAKSTWSYRIADEESGEEQVVHTVGLKVVSYENGGAE